MIGNCNCIKLLAIKRAVKRYRYCTSARSINGQELIRNIGVLAHIDAGR